MAIEWDNKANHRWDRRDRKTRARQKPRREQAVPKAAPSAEPDHSPETGGGTFAPPALSEATQSVALAPGLYLVPTPIGNLGDISKRALLTLAAANRIACEDSRKTGLLLQRLGIRPHPPLLSYHDHNADRMRALLMARLAEGEAIALVSDAGLPLISDPGYKLVRACIAAGLSVTALPGPNAALTALQLSGLPPDRFLFSGFLPPKQIARQKLLAKLKSVPVTMIFYETGPRLAACLADMSAILGGARQVAVARELTKIYEEVQRGTLADLAERYAAEAPPKGEIALVVGGNESTDDPELASEDPA